MGEGRIIKSGVNQQGKSIHYYFTYSAAPATITYGHKPGKELLSTDKISTNKSVVLGAWSMHIIEEH